MTSKNLRNIIVATVAFWTIVFACVLFAATVWTPQAGVYFQYKVPPAMSNVYMLTTNIEMPTHWVKQDGTFTKLVSTGGSVKYEKIAIVTPPNNPVCDTKFVCNTDFGWVVNLKMNTVLQCPTFKILNNSLQAYDGAQSINGQPVCID